MFTVNFSGKSFVVVGIVKPEEVGQYTCGYCGAWNKWGGPCGQCGR